MEKDRSCLGPSFFPISPALLTFRSPSRVPQILSVAWVGIVYSSPPVLSVAFKRGESGKASYGRGGDFAVNLPAEDLLFSPTFRKLLAAESVDLRTASGFTLAEGQTTGIPLIAECPIQIECIRGTLRSRFGQEFIEGEVATVHRGGVSYKTDSSVDIYRLMPLASGRRHQSSNGGYSLNYC
jgi:flavin reductase (DIM6/NTAB) family NADH-FMN oxidoreductase RutF